MQATRGPESTKPHEPKGKHVRWLGSLLFDIRLQGSCLFLYSPPGWMYQGCKASFGKDTRAEPRLADSQGKPTDLL